MNAKHGIPHDQGEQRCQAVGENAEGKVPTTAPACARTSPGSNQAAGAAGPSGCSDLPPMPWTLHEHKTNWSLRDANGKQVLYTTRNASGEAVARYVLHLVERERMDEQKAMALYEAMSLT